MSYGYGLHFKAAQGAVEEGDRATADLHIQLAVNELVHRLDLATPDSEQANTLFSVWWCTMAVCLGERVAYGFLRELPPELKRDLERAVRSFPDETEEQSDE